MPVFTAEEISRARSMDLLTYLKSYEPSELVHEYGDTYSTKEHDSLKISNGKWCWFSRGIGGASALDYLIRVRGFSFAKAVGMILGYSARDRPKPVKQQEHRSRLLLLPEPNEDNKTVIDYLKGRGIHEEVISYCIDHCLLYESKKYNNAVFLGYDINGVPRYGSIRSTGGKYKAELTGSDKHYSFALSGRSGTLHVFESAIDAMSYASLIAYEGGDWHEDSMLSLAGVFKTKREGVVPIALSQYLKDNPSTDRIILHLDGDAVGRAAAKGIVEGLGSEYEIADICPTHGKDINDELRYYIRYEMGGM